MTLDRRLIRFYLHTYLKKIQLSLIKHDPSIFSTIIIIYFYNKHPSIRCIKHELLLKIQQT